MKNIARYSYLSLVYLFFYLPIFVLIVYSFNDSQFSMVWHHFSGRWYEELLRDTGLQVIALHSLLIGFLAATCATLIGTQAAIALVYYKFFGKHALRTLVLVLIVSPEIVMGIALLILYSSVRVPLGFWTLLFSHITFCIPFVIVTVSSYLVGFDKNVYEAARDLGATDLQIFGKIFVPMLLPAIMAGWLLSFTLSLDDVIISYFVTGPEFQVLPLQIFSMVRLGVTPEVNALCTVLFLITITLVFSAQYALGKKR